MPTLNISAELYNQLQQQANTQGVSVEQWLQQQVTAAVAVRDLPTSISPEVATFADTLPHMLYVFDRQRGQNTFVNRYTRDFFDLGSRNQGVTSHFFLERVHPDDRDKFEQSYHTWQAGTQQQKIYRMRRHDGEYRWLQLYESVLSTDADDRPHEIIGIAVDVTQQCETMRVLRKSEKRLQNLLASQKVFVIRTDDAGNYTYVNRAFFERYGQDFDTLANMLGTSSMATIHTDDHIRTFQVSTYCLENPGQPVQLVVRKPNVDHEYDWTLWEFTALQQPEGHIEMQCIGVDIGDQKRSEQRLKEKSDVLALALRAAGAGTWEYDLATGMVLWDETNETIHGLEAGQFGSSYEAWRALVHPEDKASAEADLQASLQDETLLDTAFRIIRPDGEVRHMLAQATPYHDPQTGQLTHMIGVNIDITERKQAEADLRTSEARYRTITENFPNGLLALYDHDLRYVAIGGQGLARIGMSTEDLQGQRLRDVFPPEVYERDEPALKAALAGEQTETIVQFADQYFQVTTVPVWDDGEVTGGMVISRNITALRQAQDRLHELVEEHKLAIETAKLGVWTLDTATDTVTWNDRLHLIYGLSRAEFRENVDSWRELVHPDDRDYANRRLQEIYDNGYVHNVRYRIIRPDGDLRYIDASGAAIYDEQGEVVKLIGINRDVTKYERAQRDLLASERRYRALFDGSQNHITVFDENGEYVMVNDFTARFMGLTKADLIGRTVADFFGEAYYQQILERIQKVLTSGSTLYFEDEVQAGTGKQWYWSIMHPIQTKAAKGPLVQVIAYDITNRKAAEAFERERTELALELEKEQSLAELRSKLIAIISHEFRTPLTIIQSSADLLTRYYDRLETSKREAKLSNIIEQVQHLEYLLKEINSLSQANRGFLDYQPTEVDLRDFCQGVADDLKHLLTEKHTFRLTFDLRKSRVILDKVMIRHALSNLISNATKYSPDGGPITLRVAQDENDISFTVTDRGIGIPAGDQPYLFEPFKRGKNVDTIRGTGLGLSIVKEAVGYHGGTVTVKSQLKEGTSIKITIPATLENIADEDNTDR